jgi:ATP-dependent Lon protease
MSQFLPLFPLNLVAFPGEEVRLYIFEPRYQQLANECLTEKKPFGLAAVLEQSLMEVATVMEVVSIDQKFGGGEMNISTRGQSRVRIVEFYQVTEGKLYPGAQVEPLPEGTGQDLELQESVFSLMQQLHAALGITRELADSPEELRAFSVAHQVGLEKQQEYELLSLDSEVERLQFLDHHLRKIMPVVMETERLKAKAKLNGHYKNLIPPDF